MMRRKLRIKPAEEFGERFILTVLWERIFKKATRLDVGKRNLREQYGTSNPEAIWRTQQHNGSERH